MYSDFMFKVNNVDPKDKTVNLSFYAIDYEQYRNMSILKRFAKDPDISDSLISAYTLSAATISHDVLCDIMDALDSEWAEPRNVFREDVEIRLFFAVNVYEVAINETDRHNFTNLGLSIYYEYGHYGFVTYDEHTEKFLKTAREKFEKFIDIIRDGDEFDYDSRWILRMLPGVSDKVEKLMDEHNELVRFQRKLEEEHKMEEDRKRRINLLIKSENPKIGELRVSEYFDLRKRGMIHKKESIIPGIVSLFQKNILSLNSITATKMMAMIPRCRRIFYPVARGEFKVAAASGERLGDNWGEFRGYLMSSCIDTLLFVNPNPTEEEKEKIIRKTRSCLNMYEETLSRFHNRFSSINPYGKSAFILQNTCELSIQTELNIYVTYDIFERRNDVYITKDELNVGLSNIQWLAPWEYARLTR